jgi:MFS family permease
MLQEEKEIPFKWSKILPSFLIGYGSVEYDTNKNNNVQKATTHSKITPSDESDNVELPSKSPSYQSDVVYPDNNNNNNGIMDIDDAIERLGMGTFQYQVLVAAGLCFAADAMEVLLLSFLAVILKVEWQLSESQMDTVISVVFAGAMIGTLVLSPLGDVIGRRPVFTATAAIIGIAGVGTAFVTTYEGLLFARFMVGFGVGGLTVPFDTLAEFVPTSERGTNLLYIEFFWTAGTLLVPVLAWFSLGYDNGGNWEVFVIMCAIPCILSTILGMIYVPESPRWLLTKGRDQEALQILRAAAACNGVDPAAAFPEGTRLVQNQTHEKESVCDLFSPKWLKITLLLWAAWFGLAFLYYGVILAVSIVFSIHEDKDENGDGGSYNFDYTAIFISASSEIVGLCIVLLTVDKWGRVPTQVSTYLLGGASCLVLGFAAHGDSPRALLIFIAFIARMAMMGASCTTWVATTEILSTDIRATGHGAANAMARLGGFFCPYVITEGTSMIAIGVFMFIISLLTAAASWNLPETAGRALGEIHIPENKETKSQNQTNEGAPYQIM